MEHVGSSSICLNSLFRLSNLFSQNLQTCSVSWTDALAASRNGCRRGRLDSVAHRIGRGDEQGEVEYRAKDKGCNVQASDNTTNKEIKPKSAEATDVLTGVILPSNVLDFLVETDQRLSIRPSARQPIGSFQATFSQEKKNE